MLLPTLPDMEQSQRDHLGDGNIETLAHMGLKFV